jgi:hypothetical protein
MKLRILLLSALCAFSTVRAFAWGEVGHRTVALVALDALKTKPATLAAIQKILADDPNHGDLAAAAEWPDYIKPPEGLLSKTPEAEQFNHAHSTNRHWHFTNLSVGATTWDPGQQQVDSILPCITRCIDVLEGKSTVLSKLEALRFLAHLVGDLHQPLHVIDGYFDISKPSAPVLLATPTAAAFNDAGGNGLHVGSVPLHHKWDDVYVEELLSGTSGKSKSELAIELAALLEKDVLAWNAPKGDTRTWAQAWAQESFIEARQIYAGLKFGAYTPDQPGKPHSAFIEVTVDSAQQAPLVRQRLHLAGLRLAALLSAIHWQP